MLTKIVVSTVLVLGASVVSETSARVRGSGSAGPTVPCYKCDHPNPFTNPNSRCVMVDTDLFFDTGFPNCTTAGGPGGATECITSGDPCYWVGIIPWISTNGTGGLGAGLGVVVEGTEVVQTCEGTIIARSTQLSADLDVSIVVL